MVNFRSMVSGRNPPIPHLPASSQTVALYLNAKATTAASFSVIKFASVAINQYHQLNMFPTPTLSGLPSMVRGAELRRLNKRPKNVKEPWSWSLLAMFLIDSCFVLRSKPRRIVAMFAALSFATFGRYNDIQQLQWCHL